MELLGISGDSVTTLFRSVGKTVELLVASGDERGVECGESGEFAEAEDVVVGEEATGSTLDDGSSILGCGSWKTHARSSRIWLLEKGSQDSEDTSIMWWSMLRSDCSASPVLL